MRFLAILLLPFALADNSTTSEDTVDSAVLFAAIGTPSCVRRCIGNLTASLEGLSLTDDIVSHMDDVCSEFATARECLEKSVHCPLKGLMEVIWSPLTQICDEKKEQYDEVKECLRGKIDLAVEECESSCRLRRSTSSLCMNPNVALVSRVGGNVLVVADHLRPVCSALACSLPCLQSKLNAVCEMSGWLLIDSLLRPMDVAALHFSRANPALQNVIRKKVGEECSFVWDRDQLKLLREGKFKQGKKDNLIF